MFVAWDIGVGGSLQCGEVPAIVCQCFGCGEGFPGILVIVQVVGEHLDGSLVVDADIDGGVWGSGRGGDKVEAFVYGV
jgi:hypothetical protein